MLQQALPAESIPGLFNTGVDSTGNPLAGNTNDPHFTILSQPASGTFVDEVLPFPPSVWVGNSSTSRWIGPDVPAGDGTGPVGEYVYRTTFDLTGLDPTTARIEGMWASDDGGTDIRINGISTNQTNASFNQFKAFTIRSGFVSGTNTLDFVFTNEGTSSNPTGLRVEGLTGTAVPVAETTRSIELLGRYTGQTEFTLASLTAREDTGKPIQAIGQNGVKDTLIIDGTGGPIYQPLSFRGSSLAGIPAGEIGDVVRVEGSGVSIDAVNRDHLQNVAVIDLRGDGSNSLVVDKFTVTNNERGTGFNPRLLLIADADDSVVRADVADWTSTGTQNGPAPYAFPFTVYEASTPQGTVELWVSVASQTPTATPDPAPAGPTHTASELQRDYVNQADVPPQVVMIGPSTTTVGTGGTFSVDVGYRVPDPSPGTPPAVLIEVHYDADYLRLDETKSPAVGFIPEINDNLEDVEAVPDGDLRTNRVVVLSWSESIDPTWPAAAAVETALATLQFQAVQPGDTSLRVTGLSSAGYKLDSASLAIEILVGPAAWTVNSTGDAGDANAGDGVCDTGGLVGDQAECTLRAAIEEANALGNFDANSPDTILFNLAGTGPHVIQPFSPLPDLRDAVVIDGTSEPDFDAGTGNPVVEIDGSLAGAGASGLTVGNGADGSTIRGLAINRFDANGIFVSRRDLVVIEGNYLGTDAAGSSGLGNGQSGIHILNGENNTVRGNLISGNELGVLIEGRLSTGNRIAGNLIGTDAAGTARLKNRLVNVDIADAPANIIGGTGDGDRNVIAGRATATRACSCFPAATRSSAISSAPTPAARRPWATKRVC